MALGEQLKNDLKSPWLRAILIGMGVVLAVNVGFISYAFISPPNLVVKDYYEKGKRYFHDQAVREAGRGDAWRLHLLPPAAPRVGVEQVYRLRVTDHQGRPVHEGRVILFAYRPSDARYDFKVELPRADAGLFVRHVVFPLPGKWDLIAQVRAGERKYDVARRIFVRD